MKNQSQFHDVGLRWVATGIISMGAGFAAAVGEPQPPAQITEIVGASRIFQGKDQLEFYQSGKKISVIPVTSSDRVAKDQGDAFVIVIRPQIKIVDGWVLTGKRDAEGREISLPVHSQKIPTRITVYNGEGKIVWERNDDDGYSVPSISANGQNALLTSIPKIDRLGKSDLVDAVAYGSHGEESGRLEYNKMSDFLLLNPLKSEVMVLHYLGLEKRFLEVRSLPGLRLKNSVELKYSHAGQIPQFHTLGHVVIFFGSPLNA